MKTYTPPSETHTKADRSWLMNVTFMRSVFMVAILLLCSLPSVAQNKNLSGRLTDKSGIYIDYTLHGDYEVEKVHDHTDTGSMDYVINVKPGAEMRLDLNTNAETGIFGVYDRDCPSDQGIIKKEQISAGSYSYSFQMKENSFYAINFTALQLNEEKHRYDKLLLRLQCYTSFDEPKQITVEAEGSEITTIDKPKMESGDVDSETFTGWGIPAAVATTIFGIGSAAAVFGGSRKGEDDGDDSEGDDEDEPQNEDPNLAWRMMKEFGEQVFAGERPQTIAAKIVQVKESGDLPIDHLTQLIQITSPDSFEVSNVRMMGGFMAADISVKPGLKPEQMAKGGHVNFTLAANGAGNTYSMRFDIVSPTLEIDNVNVILGDNRTYKTWIRLDTIVNPRELRVLSHPDYEVVEQPVPMEGEWGDQGYFTVKILNKTKKPETNVLERKKAHYDPVEVSVEAVYDSGLAVPGVVKIFEYPEGMSFLVEKTTQGYADIQTDNARDKVIFGMNTVVRIPTYMTVYFSKYDAENECAHIMDVKKLKAAGDIVGQGEYENGLARNFDFKIEDCGGQFSFTPKTTLAMEAKDKPYLAELPLKAVVEYEDYGEEYIEGKLVMALYGLVPYVKTDWDKECERLLRIITMLELQSDNNVRKTWEHRSLYSANEIHLFSKALLEEAIQYHTMESEKYNTQAEWLSCGLACCHLLNYAGDQAAEILLKYYFGDLAAIIVNPYLKLLKAIAGELTARYIDGQPLQPTSDDEDAAWNMLIEICNGIITNEMTSWLKNPSDLKKGGGLIAIFLGLNTAKHYFLDDDKTKRRDFWTAVLSSGEDLFKESAKQLVAKFLGESLSKIGKDEIKKLSDWFGEKMKADDKLCELVIGKLEDIVKNNPVQSLIPNLYDGMMADNGKKKFDTDLFYSILVPDRDTDSHLEDFRVALELLLEVAIQPFLMVMNVAGIVSTEVRIAKKRKEDEAYK